MFKSLTLFYELSGVLLHIFLRSNFKYCNHYSLDVGTDLPNYDKPAAPTKQPRFGGFHDDDYSDAGSSDNEER